MSMAMRNILCKKKFLYYVLFAIILLVFLHPDFTARRYYNFIKKDDILSRLHWEIAENFSSVSNSDCNYKDLTNDDTTLPVNIIDGDLTERHRIKEGGEYSPFHCKPKFSVAIIVPYRDQADLLRDFLVYMHTFLGRQNIHYRIYVVEQVDSRPFNRAKLINVGATAAIRAGYPCIILHDVNVLPLKLANLYVCTECPRHMSASIDRFRFVLPYANSFGGAVAIVSQQFKKVNGMSNKYFGIEGEYDELYGRLEAYSLKPCRFEPDISHYHLATTEPHDKGERGHIVLDLSKARMQTDGLSSLQYTEVATVLHPLFTHIMVDF